MKYIACSSYEDNDYIDHFGVLALMVPGLLYNPSPRVTLGVMHVRRSTTTYAKYRNVKIAGIGLEDDVLVSEFSDTYLRNRNAMNTGKMVTVAWVTIPQTMMSCGAISSIPSDRMFKYAYVANRREAYATTKPGEVVKSTDNRYIGYDEVIDIGHVVKDEDGDVVTKFLHCSTLQAGDKISNTNAHKFTVRVMDDEVYPRMHHEVYIPSKLLFAHEDIESVRLEEIHTYIDDSYVQYIRENCAQYRGTVQFHVNECYVLDCLVFDTVGLMGSLKPDFLVSPGDIVSKGNLCDVMGLSRRTFAMMTDVNGDKLRYDDVLRHKQPEDPGANYVVDPNVVSQSPLPFTYLTTNGSIMYDNNKKPQWITVGWDYFHQADNISGVACSLPSRKIAHKQLKVKKGRSNNMAVSIGEHVHNCIMLHSMYNTAVDMGFNSDMCVAKLCTCGNATVLGVCGCDKPEYRYVNVPYNTVRMSEEWIIGQIIDDEGCVQGLCVDAQPV